MTLKNIKPTEVKIEDFEIIDFFDNRFIKLIKKHIDGAILEHFCIFTYNEKNEIDKKMMIAHESVEDKKNKILTIAASNPELLEKLIKVVDQYNNYRG